MAGAIIAIGGGEIGRPGKPVETTEIDLEIIKATNKKSPNLLFIPTASGNSQEYMAVAEEHFGKRMGCRVSHLIITPESSLDALKKQIEECDIVYVGGGDTEKMLTIWKEKGVDKFLESAWKNGKTLSGVSAGAICWFEQGIGEKGVIKGLGLVKATVEPHYKDAPTHFPCIGLTNCTALIIKGTTFEVITSQKGAHVVFIDGNKTVKQLETNKKYSFNSLFT